MSKELKVGLLAVAAIAIFYFGFNYLRGVDFLSPTSAYYVQYDNIGGLTPSNPILIDGFTVGKVSDINLVQGDSNQIWVRLDVNNDIILGVGTVAHLVNNDAFGSKAIVLEINNITQPLASGDTLIGEVEKGLLDQLAESTMPITDNIGVTIRRINAILDNLTGSSDQIKNIISNMDTTLNELKITEQRVNKNLQRSFDNFNQMLVSYDSLSGYLVGVSKNAVELTDSLKQIRIQETLDHTNALLAETKELVSQMKNDQGTLGKLMTDDQLYTNLNEMIITFDSLGKHLDENPRHFFAPFGKKPKKKKKRDR